MSILSRGFSRRETTKILVAGLAAAMAPSALYGGSAGKRKEIAVSWPGYDSFRLGEFEVTTIYDVGYEVAVTPDYFAIGQQPDDISALLQARFLPVDRTIESVVPTLVEAGQELLLFDTGVGAGSANGKNGQLVERMKSSGYQADDVSTIVLSHLHRDNIGGILNAGSVAFKNASRYVIGEVEYKFWTENVVARQVDSGLVDLVKETFKDLKDKVELVAGGGSVVPGVTAIEAFGHTPGHLAYEIVSGGKRLLVAGDVATHFVVSFEKPQWETSADIDRSGAAATRVKILEDAAAQRTPIIGYHLPFPPVGYVERTGDDMRWMPETYQLSL